MPQGKPIPAVVLIYNPISREYAGKTFNTLAEAAKYCSGIADHHRGAVISLSTPYDTVKVHAFREVQDEDIRRKYFSDLPSYLNF